jgi:O-antigen/teichoic acid export membrane protein
VRLARQSDGQSSSRRQLHPFVRDVGVTLLAQVAFAALSLLTFRLLAQKTGTDGFASYSLVRQAAAIVFPIITVGLVGGLPRYIALPQDAHTPSSEAYLLAGIAICGSVTAVTGILALGFEDATAALFFGSSTRTELVFPFVALIGATAVFQLAYGYYRGLLRVRTASALQVGAYALPPPLIVLAFSDEPVGTLILLVAIAMALTCLVTITGPLVRAFRRDRRRRTARAARSLWDYGHRRVPGELAQLGLVVLVPILAAHVGTLTDVAYLTAGQQVLSMLSLAVLPLGLVLLPTLARLWADDRDRAAQYVAQLAAFASHLAIFLSLQTILFADIAVRIWLGSGFDDAGAVVRITVAPAALFVVYLMLRSTLDAVEVRSYNSRNNIIALAVFGAVASSFLALDVTEPVFCVAWAFCAGVTTQGLLTFLTVHRLFGLAQADYLLRLAVPLGLGAGLVGLAARPLIDGSSAELLMLLALELLLAFVYFGALVRARAAWVVLLRERFFQRA